MIIFNKDGRVEYQNEKGSYLKIDSEEKNTKLIFNLEYFDGETIEKSSIIIEVSSFNSFLKNTDVVKNTLEDKSERNFLIESISLLWTSIELSKLKTSPYRLFSNWEINNDQNSWCKKMFSEYIIPCLNNIKLIYELEDNLDFEEDLIHNIDTTIIKFIEYFIKRCEDSIYDYLININSNLDEKQLNNFYSKVIFTMNRTNDTISKDICSRLIKMQKSTNIDEITKRIEIVKKQTEELNIILQTLEEKQQKIKRNSESVSEIISEQKESLNEVLEELSITEKIKQLKLLLSDIQELNSEADETLEKMSNTNSSFKRKEKRIDQKLEQLNNTLKELNIKISTYQSINDDLKSMTSKH